MDVMGHLHDVKEQHDFGEGSGMIRGSLVFDKYYDRHTISAQSLYIAGFYTCWSFMHGVVCSLWSLWKLHGFAGN